MPGTLLELLPEYKDFEDLVEKASDRPAWNNFVRKLTDISAPLRRH